MTAMQKSLQEEDVSGTCLYWLCPQSLCLNLDIWAHRKRGGVFFLYVFTCRYLIQELHQVVTGGNSCVFCPAAEEGKWKLQPGVSFLFFTSHTPCESSIHSMALTGPSIPPNVCNVVSTNWKMEEHLKCVLTLEKSTFDITGLFWGVIIFFTVQYLILIPHSNIQVTVLKWNIFWSLYMWFQCV